MGECKFFEAEISLKVFVIILFCFALRVEKVKVPQSHQLRTANVNSIRRVRIREFL